MAQKLGAFHYRHKPDIQTPLDKTPLMAMMLLNGAPKFLLENTGRASSKCWLNLSRTSNLKFTNSFRRFCQLLVKVRSYIDI